MSDFLINFSWQRDPEGYYIAPKERARDPRPGESFFSEGVLPSPLRIIARSRRFEVIRPFDVKSGTSLWATFANIDNSTALLDFVTKYGPLSGWLLTSGEYVAAHTENVPEALAQARVMRDMLIANRGNGRVGSQIERIDLGGFSAAVVFDKKTKVLQVQYSPRNLLSALWLQLSFGLTDGVTGRVCQHCGQIFAAGPGTGRRGGADFCTPEHQIKHKSLGRSLKRRR